MDRIVGVDLGGTLIRSVLTDLSGEKIARAQRLTNADQGPEAVIERILYTIEDVFPDDGAEQVIGIGVGVPGPVDPASGTLYDPPNLPGWEAVTLPPYIGDAFGVPAFISNDANVAALGEYRFGAGQGVQDFVYITVSTGIGSGIISGGRVLNGARGFAGEAGHQTLDPDGPLCGCGQPGHLEAFASGPAIARDARQRLQAGESSVMREMVNSLDEVTAETVGRAATEGDELARQLIARAGFYIGVGLANLIHIVEPKRIAIGGGVSRAGDLLFEPIRETVSDRLWSDVYQGVEIVPAALADDVGLLGAVALALAELESSES